MKKRLWPRLTRVADDGCLEMSNKAAERAADRSRSAAKNFLLVPAVEDVGVIKRA